VPAPSALEAPTSLDALLEQLEHIRPVIESDRDAAEQQGRLTSEIIEALKQAGFLRIYLPRHYGGLELDPPTFFRLTERLSRIDSAVGWQMGIYNQITHISAARLSREVTDGLFLDDPNVLLCGSLNSVGKAIPEGDGYRFTSQAPFNSGCHFADYCLMQGQVQRELSPEGTPPELIALCCPIKDVEIVDNWDVVGMRGSGSNDVRVTRLYVPGEMCATWSPCATTPT